MARASRRGDAPTPAQADSHTKARARVASHRCAPDVGQRGAGNAPSHRRTRKLARYPSIPGLAGQAPKEFTVNEALLRADLALHCTIEGEQAAPPASPAAGQAWLIVASPTGAFAGHAAAIAGLTASGLRFIAARTGLRVYDKIAGCFRHFIDSWQRGVTRPLPTGGTIIDQRARTAIGTCWQSW